MKESGSKDAAQMSPEELRELHDFVANLDTYLGLDEHRSKPDPFEPRVMPVDPSELPPPPEIEDPLHIDDQESPKETVEKRIDWLKDLWEQFKKAFEHAPHFHELPHEPPQPPIGPPPIPGQGPKLPLPKRR